MQQVAWSLFQIIKKHKMAPYISFGVIHVPQVPKLFWKDIIYILKSWAYTPHSDAVHANYFSLAATVKISAPKSV